MHSPRARLAAQAGTARMRGAAGCCSLGGRIAPAIAVLLTWSAQRVWQTEQQTQESSVKEDTLQAITKSNIVLIDHAVEHDGREPSCRIHRNATWRERPHDTDISSCAAVARAASRSLCRATKCRHRRGAGALSRARPSGSLVSPRSPRYPETSGGRRRGNGRRLGFYAISI